MKHKMVVTWESTREIDSLDSSKDRQKDSEVYLEYLESVEIALRRAIRETLDAHASKVQISVEQ